MTLELKERTTQQKLYSIQEAAKKLGINRSTLYKNYYRGNIEIIKVGNKSKLTEDTINELYDILHTNKVTTATEFAKANHVSETTIYSAIKEFNIKPIDNNFFALKSYKLEDLNRIHKLWREKRSKVKYFKKNTLKPINTQKIFNRKTDYTMYTLSKLLSPNQPLSNKMIVQWVDYDKVPYSVDINGKIFFTPEQATKIKDKYLKLPEDVAYTNQELAQKMHIHPSTLITFRKFYNLGGHRVLGSQNFFYTNQEAEKIMQMWKDPEVANYPNRHQH